MWVFVDIQLESLENASVASPGEAVWWRGGRDTRILAVVLPGSVVAPEYFTEHGRQDSRCGAHGLGNAVARRVQKTQKIAGFPGEYVGMEVHYIVRQR